MLVGSGSLISASARYFSCAHLSPFLLGVRITGTLGDIEPLNKVPFKRATSGVQKGPL